MKRTDEQQDIIDHIGTRNCFSVMARAGTGKSTTGAMICKTNSKKKIKYVSFTRDNADDLKKKMPLNVDCSTWNSFGVRSFAKFPELDKWKMPNIVSQDEEYDIRRASKEDKANVSENKDNMLKLCNLVKNYSINPTEEDVIFLLDNYEVSLSLPRSKVIEDALRFVEISDGIKHKVDFTDQIRFPVIGNTLKADFDKFIVDEQQDNTPIRTIGMEQLMNKGVQVGGLGDDLQSMYGFAGADCFAMQNWIKVIGEENVFPLTINFRCDKNIIREAQKVVPDIKWFEEKDDGIVRRIETQAFSENFKEGDVAISRFNKIIIPACFRLIKEGKKATIIGRDFGDQLKNMITGFNSTSIEDFYKKIDLWLKRKSQYLEEGSAMDAIMDKHECLKFFADSCETVEDILKRIDDIFNTSTDGYRFCTGHKAKGMEWPRVFVLDSSKFKMSRNGMKPMQIQQENNIFYVAITRPQHELVYVG